MDKVKIKTLSTGKAYKQMVSKEVDKVDKVKSNPEVNKTKNKTIYININTSMMIVYIESKVKFTLSTLSTLLKNQ